MATITGPRELPRPGKATQPSYPTDHSPLIGTHSVLLFWPWSNLQTQKAAVSRESSTLNKPSTQMDKYVSHHLLATVFFERKHQQGPKQGRILVIHAHSSVHSCPVTNHPFWSKRPSVLVLVYSKLLDPDIHCLSVPEAALSNK